MWHGGMLFAEMLPNATDKLIKIEKLFAYV